MYLSKLEIFGFKSFASKTIINFTKGITGIVGPNGCGKTNIVDGIRWALGEQKSSMLRSDKMENVIFNGTRARKPMGMAEISLTLVNDSGLLPTEYSEVTITRRIFRSGESEYLLNKNICRLKDITSLFMDTGMGTNAYSVIELKMVETILSNKADERRHMFEEAAGVNKYKMRRRLSLKKLDEVKADLVRVNDIVAEVEKNVRSLQRQAKRADKYNQLQSLLREKEVDLAEREFANYTNFINKYNSEKNELNESKTSTDQSIRSIETELIEFRDKIRVIENELSEKRNEISKYNDKLHETQNSMSVAEERSRSLTQNIEKYTDEITELKNQISETSELVEANGENIINTKHQIENKQKSISETEAILSDKKNALDSKRNELKSKSDESTSISKRINSKENQLASLKKTLEGTNEEIENLEDFIQKATNNIAKTVGYLEDLSTEKEQAQTKLNETDSLLAQRQKEKLDLEKKLNELQHEELDQKNVLNAFKNKLELLQTMITNLEGLSSASRELIENKNWSEKGKTLFADVGKTKDEYRHALEAALKSVLNNLLIENIDDLNKAVSYLKENDLGKASFFLLNQLGNNGKSFIDKLYSFSINRKRIKIQKEDNFINWAFDLVDTTPKWQPYFRKVLIKTAIVNDLDTALKLSQKYSDFTFVTLNGDLITNNGIVEAGSLPKLDQSLFGRKQMLEDMKKEYPLHEKKLQNIRNEISETEKKIENIDLKNISDRGKTLLNEINNIEKQISQLEFEKKKYSEEIESAQEKIRKLVNDASATDNESSTLKNEITQLQNEEIAINEEVAKFETELKHLEHEYNELANNLNQNKLHLERLNGQLTNTENEITRLEQTLDRIKTTIEKRETDISASNNELNEIHTQVEDLQKTYNEISLVRDGLISEENEIKSRLSEIKEKASGLESELNEHRNNRQELSDKVHDLDIKISEYKMKLENIVEHIQEEYALELTYKEFDDLDTFNFKEISAEVHDYKRKIKELGPINLLAYSEYEEENERLEFLLKQRDDLVQSEKDLVNTIEEINEAAEKLFLETFANIRENFQKIFRTLFDPGDEADLMLQEDVDPLEAKIEIVAKPKGKRPTSIELLSGGEKTLTATALLFAIYLVKPSPFCILDEVDAPLDDANIDRFTKLLKEFSEKTQFIIVTHNKRTMVSAENMYGVTMQEEGVSKIAAVQFNDDMKIEKA